MSRNSNNMEQSHSTQRIFMFSLDGHRHYIMTSNLMLSEGNIILVPVAPRLSLYVKGDQYDLEFIPLYFCCCSFCSDSIISKYCM